MTAVVIPAHNEAAVIKSTLGALLDGLDPTVDVVVVCNGCTDATADVARSVGAPVRVIEIDAASKIAALNAGDASVAGSFPVVYVDADVTIGGAAVHRIVETLQRPGVYAAGAVARFEFGDASWLVRAYYRFWVALHRHGHGDVGGGVYAMSEQGRSRFGAFPDVVADDTYVRSLFLADEYVTVHDAESVVHTPTRFVDLVRVATRSRLGNIQLFERFPELGEQKRQETSSLKDKLRRVPWQVWPWAPLYIGVRLYAEWRARRQFASSETYRWERDDSSRQDRSRP